MMTDKLRRITDEIGRGSSEGEGTMSEATYRAHRAEARAAEAHARATDEYRQLKGNRHAHTYSGQTLKHTHEDGAIEHGYFGHVEDTGYRKP